MRDMVTWIAPENRSYFYVVAAAFAYSSKYVFQARMLLLCVGRLLSLLTVSVLPAGSRRPNDKCCDASRKRAAAQGCKQQLPNYQTAQYRRKLRPDEFSTLPTYTIAAISSFVYPPWTRSGPCRSSRPAASLHCRPWAARRTTPRADVRALPHLTPRRVKPHPHLPRI